jgi:hypothetical protein
LGNAPRAAFLVGVAAVGLALASLDTPPRTRITLPPSIHGSSFPFFIGAWVGPRTAPDDPEAWRRFARAGLEVSFRPLETRTIARATSRPWPCSIRWGSRCSRATTPSIPTRPRVPAGACACATSSRRTAATARCSVYFVADEPQPAVADSVAAIAAEFRAHDPRHSAYVNLLPPTGNASEAAQARWRAAAARMIERGRLALWSWSAYSQRRSGEDAAFLLTQRNALQVGRATGVPGIAILQFTGFADLDPLPRAQLDYLAAESIAHGARGIVWFTWWTPDPRESGQHWRGGAIAYDGHTDRACRHAGPRQRTRARPRRRVPGSGRRSPLGAPRPPGGSDAQGLADSGRSHPGPPPCGRPGPRPSRPDGSTATCAGS